MMTEENQQNTQDSHEPDNERRRKVFVWLTEIGLVGSSVVIFIAFLSFLIGVYFPEGSALVGERQEDWFGDTHDAENVELRIDTQASDTSQLFSGEIVSISRRVQRRGGRSLAWNTAQLGDKFVQNDAVQTFSRSTASLEINDSSLLTIGENSLIIFGRQQTDPFSNSQESVLIMVNGELSGTLSGDDNSRFRFGVNLPNGDVTLMAQNPGDEVEFRITVNADRSTTLSLHSGMAEIVGRDGQRVTISAYESITMDSTGTRLRVSNLPSAPTGIGPSNNTVVSYRNVPQKIRFNWTSVERADRYHIVIARDPAFSDRLVDDDVVGTSFTHGALGAGTYYWHVRSRVAWAQSSKSNIHRIRVLQDLEAPKLHLDPPADAVVAGIWRLTGRTDPDASVYVDGVQITHNAGRIDQEISLRRGANIITVKAMDGVGNLNYASLAINAK